MRNEHEFNRYPQFEPFTGEHKYIGQGDQPRSKKGRRPRRLGRGWVIVTIILIEIAFYAVVLGGHWQPQAGEEIVGPRHSPSSIPSALPNSTDRNSISQK